MMSNQRYLTAISSVKASTVGVILVLFILLLIVIRTFGGNWNEVGSNLGLNADHTDRPYTVYNNSIYLLVLEGYQDETEWRPLGPPPPQTIRSDSTARIGYVILPGFPARNVQYAALDTFGRLVGRIRLRFQYEFSYNASIVTEGVINATTVLSTINSSPVHNPVVVNRY